MIGIINYGFGNIGSLVNALSNIDINNKIVEDPQNINNFSHLILPGVGSFKKSMEVLVNEGWKDEISTFVKKGNFLAGICLGMQILFDYGEEDGPSKGLGFINGKVSKIKINKNQVLPHVGWNNLINILEEDVIFTNTKKGVDFYFDHSYECLPVNKKTIIAETPFSLEKNFVSMVKSENIYGIQFHPEKSHNYGEILLNNFSKI